MKGTLMREKKILYYTDELNDEFSTARITSRVIDGTYPYLRGNFWDFCSRVVQNVLTMPVKMIYSRWKFHLKYVGREKFRECKGTGYFIYANHTQVFADTFIPSLANYPKRNFFIVHPNNVSMPGLHNFVELCGALPIPSDFSGMKNFWKALEERIDKKHSVTIYPEAHIWPYYTHIRPFSAVSFQYPVKLNCPVYCITNTYRRRGKSGTKVNIVTYVDGPFYPDVSLKNKERQQALRDQVYQRMVERSRESDFELIEYRRRN